MAYRPLGSRLPPATFATLATVEPEKPQSVATVATVADPLCHSDDLDAFEERAAIAEFDGGLSRAHAEVLAALHTAPMPPDVTPEHLSNVINACALFLDRRSQRQ